jgi:hypothetical protein
MAAGFFGCPELLMSDEEAETVGTATQGVLNLYESEVDPRVMAWMMLIGALVWVYGTRIYAIRARLKAEAAANPQAPGNVLPFEKRAPQPSAATPEPAKPDPRPAGPTGTPQDLFGQGYSAALAEPV